MIAAACATTFFASKFYDFFGLAAACALLGALVVAVLSARERVYFALFADRLPRCKQKPLAAKTTWYLFQTGSASMLSIFAMHKSSLIFWTPPANTLSYWFSTFVPFYALLALRDVFFLGPLHPLLHSPRWYHLHKLRKGTDNPSSTSRLIWHPHL